MKKQILTLSMCLALTATSALAAGTSAVIQKNAVKAPTTITAPVNAQVKPTAPTVNQEPATCQRPSREEMKKMMEDKIAKERELMYNALQMTDEQKAKAIALDQKTKEGFKPLISKFRIEKIKLEKLKKDKACGCKIWKQKQALKATKREIKTYLDNSKKSFEAILTPEQKAKFKIMDAQRKAQMEKFRKEHRHHGSKGMKFKGHVRGNMAPPPCDCPKCKETPGTPPSTPCGCPKCKEMMGTSPAPSAK